MVQGVGFLLEWRCKCGWSEPEDGDLKGAGRAGGHLSTAKRQGEQDDHGIIGLVDTETGDVVVERLNMRAAMKAFGREVPRPGPKEKAAPEPKAPRERAASATPSAGRKGFVVVASIEVSGVCELLFQADIAAHPEWFHPDVLTDEKVRAAEMGKWFEQGMIRLHYDHARELGFDRFFQAALAENGVPAYVAAGGE